jgi:hypothetical protein
MALKYRSMVFQMNHILKYIKSVSSHSTLHCFALYGVSS